MNNLKKELMTELKQIWDNKDFVCGAMSNASTEENWLYMLDYIKKSKKTEKAEEDLLSGMRAILSDRGFYPYVKVRIY